jgi:protein-disulfide isomerase
VIRSRLAPLLATALLASCGPASHPPTDLTIAAAPSGPRPPLPAPTAAPRPLRGLADVELDPREASVFWTLVSQLYAPCPSLAISLAQCVEEARPCAACAPAARLLAERVRAGADAGQAREVYAIRFGPNVVPVDPADSPSLGPEGAPVTVVVFSDFECPYCGRAVPLIERAVKRFSPHVRLVHKFYPLNQHAHARDAAKAALAAQNQGKYWEMEKQLFSHQRDLTEVDLEGYAQELGLDLARFKADMQSPRAEKILQRDHDAGEAAGLSGTPHIMINGREFSTTYFHIESDLEPWIELELKLGK